MTYLLIKGMVSGILIVGISEIAKRSPLAAAILRSLPLTSILAMVWMYSGSGNVDQVASCEMHLDNHKPAGNASLFNISKNNNY